MLLFIVRHGDPIYNPDSLTPKGHLQAQALAKRFETVDFRPMEIPVLFNCLGDVKDDTQTIPELLVRQVQSSVYMEDTIRRLAELGVDTIVEIGPGKALSGFVKKTVGSAITCLPVEDLAGLQSALAVLKGEAHE